MNFLTRIFFWNVIVEYIFWFLFLLLKDIFWYASFWCHSNHWIYLNISFDIITIIHLIDQNLQCHSFLRHQFHQPTAHSIGRTPRLFCIVAIQKIIHIQNHPCMIFYSSWHIRFHSGPTRFNAVSMLACYWVYEMPQKKNNTILTSYSSYQHHLVSCRCVFFWHCNTFWKWIFSPHTIVKSLFFLHHMLKPHKLLDDW